MNQHTNTHRLQFYIYIYISVLSRVTSQTRRLVTRLAFFNDSSLLESVGDLTRKSRVTRVNLTHHDLCISRVMTRNWLELFDSSNLTWLESTDSKIQKILDFLDFYTLRFFFFWFLPRDFKKLTCDLTRVKNSSQP